MPAPAYRAGGDDKVEAAGIEREERLPKGTIQQEVAKLAGDLSPQCIHLENNDRQRLAADDAILRRVIRCWPALSDETKASINAMVVDALLFDS